MRLCINVADRIGSVADTLLRNSTSLTFAVMHWENYCDWIANISGMRNIVNENKNGINDIKKNKAQ